MRGKAEGKRRFLVLMWDTRNFFHFFVVCLESSRYCIDKTAAEYLTFHYRAVMETEVADVWKGIKLAA